MCTFQGIPDYLAQSAQEGTSTSSLRAGEDGTRLSISRQEPIRLPELTEKKSLMEVDGFLGNVIKEGNAMTRRYIASQILDEV